MPYAKFHDLPGEIVALRFDEESKRSGGPHNPSGMVATLLYEDGRSWSWTLAEIKIGGHR